jgi:hypothetical protein
MTDLEVSAFSAADVEDESESEEEVSDLLASVESDEESLDVEESDDESVESLDDESEASDESVDVLFFEDDEEDVPDDCEVEVEAVVEPERSSRPLPLIHSQVPAASATATIRVMRNGRKRASQLRCPRCRPMGPAGGFSNSSLTGVSFVWLSAMLSASHHMSRPQGPGEPHKRTRHRFLSIAILATLLHKRGEK